MANGMAKRPPDLHHAVKILEGISRDTPSKTPKAIGEIYVASLALLYHLKLDQSAIRTIRYDLLILPVFWNTKFPFEYKN